MIGQSSSYQRDLDSFGAHVCDEGAFHALWHGFDALRQDHAAGRVAAVSVGLGLRAAEGDQAPKPSIVLQIAHYAQAFQAPSMLAGLPVHVEEVGKILAGPQPMAAAAAPFTRSFARPPCGVSIAPLHTNYSGTLGFYVRNQGEPSQRPLMVSCRHVLDPELNGVVGGPDVQQQSFEDGNVSQSAIARLSYAGVLSAGEQAPQADVAAAEVSVAVDPRIMTGVGSFAPIVMPAVVPTPLARVRKSGRTSGATIGLIDLVTTQTRVEYGNGESCLFTDCVTVADNQAPFFLPGDTGALLTSETYQPIGMLFALAEGQRRQAYAHRIDVVLSALNAAAGPGAAFEIVTGG